MLVKGGPGCRCDDVAVPVYNVPYASLILVYCASVPLMNILCATCFIVNKITFEETIRCHEHCHWSPTVPVSVWLPEPARDRGSKQKALSDDCYHTTCRSAAMFGVQTVLSYLVLTLNLWIGLCPMKRSSGVWSFDEVSVTIRWLGPYVPVTYYRNRLWVSQQFRCFTGHNLIMFQYVSLHLIDI